MISKAEYDQVRGLLVTIFPQAVRAGIKDVVEPMNRIGKSLDLLMNEGGGAVLQARDSLYAFTQLSIRVADTLERLAPALERIADTQEEIHETLQRCPVLVMTQPPPMKFDKAPIPETPPPNVDATTGNAYTVDDTKLAAPVYQCTCNECHRLQGIPKGKAKECQFCGSDVRCV